MKSLIPTRFTFRTVQVNQPLQGAPAVGVGECLVASGHYGEARLESV